MQKQSNDFDKGLNKLVVDSNKRKENNIGKMILDTHLTPDYTEKQSVLVDISDLYASPKKWNFYDQLSDDKKLELMESIQDNGILSPIIAWEISYIDIETEYTDDEVDVYDMQGNKYLVLAGHNRVDAFIKLHKTTNDDKYLKIPAFIFKKDEITIEAAKSIVVDTNYVQRILSTKEKVKSVMYKYAELEKNKIKKGNTKDIIAEELNMSPRMVMHYKKLGDVITPLQDMVYDETLTLTSVLKVADKTKDLQEWLVNTYKDKLSSKILNKIKPYMKRGDIERLFNKENSECDVDLKTISFEIPSHLEAKAIKLINNLIDRNKNK